VSGAVVVPPPRFNEYALALVAIARSDRAPHDRAKDATDRRARGAVAMMIAIAIGSPAYAAMVGDGAADRRPRNPASNRTRGRIAAAIIAAVAVTRVAVAVACGIAVALTV